MSPSYTVAGLGPCSALPGPGVSSRSSESGPSFQSGWASVTQGLLSPSLSGGPGSCLLSLSLSFWEIDRALCPHPFPGAGASSLPCTPQALLIALLTGLSW